MLIILSVCPFRVNLVVYVVKSQMRIVVSSLELANKLPEFIRTKSLTVFEWPINAVNKVIVFKL